LNDSFPAFYTLASKLLYCDVVEYCVIPAHKIGFPAKFMAVPHNPSST